MLINTEQQLIQGILNHGPDILSQCLADIENPNVLNYISRVVEEKLDYPIPMTEVPKSRLWFIPNEYKQMDIEGFLVTQCPKENYDRLIKELELFRKNDMIDVLRAMKYIVDTLRANDIVWGVGRGSSVSSYVLFLIGIHKIDSIKYDLPISDFFKGE